MQEGQEPIADNQPQPGANAESQQDNGTVGKVEDLPQWAQSLVKDLRNESAANRKAKKDAEAAAQQAREKELAEQQAWKELADQRAAKVAELEAAMNGNEAITEKLAKYEKALQANVSAQLKNVPEPFKPLLARLDLTEQIEWLAANADKLNISGVPATQQPSGRVNEVNKERAQQRQAEFTRNIF